MRKFNLKKKVNGRMVLIFSKFFNVHTLSEPGDEVNFNIYEIVELILHTVSDEYEFKASYFPT